MPFPGSGDRTKSGEGVEEDRDSVAMGDEGGRGESEGEWHVVRFLSKTAFRKHANDVGMAQTFTVWVIFWHIRLPYFLLFQRIFFSYFLMCAEEIYG